jgi:hypothetical protein
MAWVVANIGRIMVVSGVLTLTMLYAAIAPEAALQSTFGQTLSGPVASVVVRNWGALIGLMGAMLIYGAFNPPVRSMALGVAGTSKVIFVLLVLAQGQTFLNHQAGIAIVVDAVWVGIFAMYLLAARRTLPADLKVGTTIGGPA